MADLSDKVCLVTGASRGIGRGVALQLVTHGATCYITGRNLQRLKLVEDEVKSRGLTGNLIPVECDHSCDEKVESLFKQIAEEQNGQLDLLLNNAFAGVEFIMERQTLFFWDQEATDSWDKVNDVGLRNNYICAVYAARMMVARRRGLIINISSMGGKCSVGFPSSCVGNAGNDRMAKDCAFELSKYNVAFLSLWPSFVKTEYAKKYYESYVQKTTLNQEEIFFKRYYEVGETPEHCGKVVVHLLSDQKIMRRSGQIVQTTDISMEYKFKDIDGGIPAGQRSIKLLLVLAGANRIASHIPNWITIPKSIFYWLISLVSPSMTNKLPSKYE